MSSAARESTDSLAEFARETGGYLLAYLPENGVMDGSYRRIQVMVRQAKWRVRAKAGYWANPGR